MQKHREARMLDAQTQHKNQQETHTQKHNNKRDTNLLHDDLDDSASDASEVGARNVRQRKNMCRRWAKETRRGGRKKTGNP